MRYTVAMNRLRKWLPHLVRVAGAGICLLVFFLLEDHVDRLRLAATAAREIRFKDSFLTSARVPLKGNSTIAKVVLAGPFNNWSVSDPHNEMRKTGTVWSITKRFPPGETQYKFVVHLEGRPQPVWVHNPEEPRWADDGFGGRNSVLLVREYGEVRVLLHVILPGLAGVLLLYSLMHLFFQWFFASRLSLTSRLLLVFIFVFVISNAGIIWFNIGRQRQLVREGFSESMHLLHASLMGLGVDFRQLRQPLASSAGQLFHNAVAAAFRTALYRVRTRGGDSLYGGQGSSIHRIVLFNHGFEVVHIADREELPVAVLPPGKMAALRHYYRDEVFGTLVARIRKGVLPEGDAWYGIFGDPDKGQVSRDFRGDSRMLGFNIILRPLLLEADVVGYYGVVLFPSLYASRIRESLFVNLGWSLFLILFSVAYFLLRPRTRPLSPEMIAAFAGSKGLTAREEEITGFLVRGMDYRTLADSLFISVKTVKAHVYNIYQKTGVGNRLELFEKIRKNG